MSAVLGVNRTKMDTPTPANRLAKGLFDGRVKVSIDTYEAAALESGSTIKMGGTLPAGARVIDQVLDTDNLGNNTTLAVGDSDTAARYIAAVDHGAAALVSRLDVIGGRDYVIGTNTGDNQVVITTGAGEATGTIKLITYYVQD